MNPKKLLLPAACLYGVAVWLRRRWYSAKRERSYYPPVPTICVGNIAVGGTGKTPHSEYVIRLLKDNYRVALLSRGYKRKTKGFVLAQSVPAASLDAAVIGDEPLQYYGHFPDVPIAVCEKRKEGIRALLALYPDLEAIVLDDAYQHVRITPLCNILLTTYQKPYCNDYPMPAGRLREFPSAAAVANVVIITRSPAQLQPTTKEQWRSKLKIDASVPLFFTRYRYLSPRPVTPAASLTTLAATTEVVLLTAIADTSDLMAHLTNYVVIAHYNYSDHRYFSEKEILAIKKRFFNDTVQTQRVLFTTEKDFMRLRMNNVKNSLSLLPVFVMPIEVEFLWEESNIFNSIIESYVRKS